MIAPIHNPNRNVKPKHSEPPIATPPSSSAANRFVWGFGVVMVIIAGGGFLMKLIEFVTVLLSDEPMQFAFLPVVTYLMVASGYACLFFWAYVSGHFKNIEGPKYRMLEMQNEIDRSGHLND